MYKPHEIQRPFERPSGETEKYSILKKSLAKKFRNDREAYTEAKTNFIKLILRRAGGVD